MKQWITLLAATALFTSCSKQALQDEQLQQENTAAQSFSRSTQEGAYASNWEQYGNWTKTDDGEASVFTYNRKSSEAGMAANGGLVLGFAKANATDPLYYHLTQPKRLPFYYLPETARSLPQMFYFSEVVAGDNIVLRYRRPLTKEEAPTLPDGKSLQELQFQHVIFTKEFLDSRGLTAQNVQNNYTYEQVMALVNP